MIFWVQSWRWRKHCPPKRWYPSATLHGTAIKKITNPIHSYSYLHRR